MSCKHCHNDTKTCRRTFWTEYSAELLSLTMLIGGALLSHFTMFGFRFWYYLAAALPVAVPVVSDTVRQWRKLDFFNEYSLMLLASVGAFAIGEYPEAVAVLLFYSIGEKLEDDASDKARGRIRSLLDSMPKDVSVVDAGGTERHVKPDEVGVGDIISVLPGERVALDGTLSVDLPCDFDTAAITGESVPRSVSPGGEVMSGYIPVDRAVHVTVTREYSDSTMNRIMKMIEEAASKKSEPETLLRKITRWYTPAVMVLAALLFIVPWIVSLINPGFVFDWQAWLRRSLVLLVCSCPCALVVSIPLSYFAAIGAASKFGVLFKGSRYLDSLRSVDTVVLDKTGTLTTGDFTVSKIIPASGVSPLLVLSTVAALDADSVHPLAAAIVADARVKGLDYRGAQDVVTVPHGIKGVLDGKIILVGSRTLMAANGITVPVPESDSTEVCVASDGKFMGAIYLDDTLKPGVRETVKALRRRGVKQVIVLSGDRDAAVAKIAGMAGADSWRGQLMPQEKHQIVENLEREGHKVAFVGDGVNDAPSLAAADVGIAIGTGGTDVAMESADAVITGNSLGRLADAFSLSRKIKTVVTENVSVAIGVKVLVIVLGAMGMASLWAAVFADTGITLLTIIWTLIVLRSGKNQ